MERVGMVPKYPGDRRGTRISQMNIQDCPKCRRVFAKPNYIRQQELSLDIVVVK